MFSNPTEILRQCGVSSGSVVGDFGVGEGSYARAAAAAVGMQGAVYAFDVQKSLVERLAKGIAHDAQSVIHPLWADLELPRSTTLADDTLDLAIIANVLFQVDHKEGFIAEAV